MFEQLISLYENPVIKKAGYIIVVAIITFVIANILSRALKKSYKKTLELKAKHEKLGKAIVVISKTKFNVLRRIALSIVYIMGALMIMSSFPELKKISYSIFASAGILAVIIGFATQEMFSNLVAGVFISIFEPFRLDDRVTIGESSGFVEDITLWHTIIRDFNNQRLMIPNSIIAKEKVLNYSIGDEKTLNFIDFGISYDSDIDLARKIISEEVSKHPLFIDNRDEHSLLAKEEPYKVRVTSHGDFSIGLRLYVWTATATDGFKLKADILESTKKRFDAEGVEIPFPYRTVVQKKDIPRPKRLAKK